MTTRRIAELLTEIRDVVTSPALRCLQTARAIWPQSADFDTDSRLWEQDFGAHDGLRFDELPDLGRLSAQELAAYRAPGGESFDDLCERASPALLALADRAEIVGGPVALVCHAGVIRAGLSLVLASRPAALSFEIAPLSITRLRVGPEGPVSVIETNRVSA